MTFTKFIPYNMKTCIVKVKGYDQSLIRGTVTNSCFEGEVVFDNQIQLLFRLDELFDSFNFPQKAMESRSFNDKPDPARDTPGMIPAQETEDEKTLATFKINVLFRQNASWQGSIVWLESNLESQFRSVLELLMIIDSAFKT